MRLKSIKLAGFKSFVDPTTIHLPSHLTGVVGPNGCGKSNVIDAVRWVMGESSAKHLRGESMNDVIFNGTNTRKPVGKASVELVFDNSQGALKGEYAKYNEISIKRDVTRDSQSNYYLNGTKCRRRDITDIFLGTGLGPRSYSIIEQGMISRLIEAKPEEFRSYLEEAAGISKYKERRRETENKIRHTLENLERLSDIRDELDKQLTKLKSQARAAERFKALKEEERLLSAQLNSIQWRSLQSKLQEKKENIDSLDLKRESLNADLQNTDTQIEKQRIQHTELNDCFNEVQGRYYEVGAEIARYEQQIRHIEAREQELTQDIEQVSSEHVEASSRLKLDKERIESHQLELAEITPRHDAAKQSSDLAKSELEQAECRLNQWQSTWDQHHQSSSKTTQVAHVEQAKVQHSEAQVEKLQRRMVELQSEIKSIDEIDYTSEISDLEEAAASLANQEQHIQAEKTAIQDQIQVIRSALSSMQQELNKDQGQYREMKGRLASLEALQEAALGKKNQSVVKWLEQKGLAGHRRLAETLVVQSGFEKAVETVLGETLESICIDALEDFQLWADSFEKGELRLFEAKEAANSNAYQSALKPLSDVLESQHNLTSLVDGVYLAESLSDALSIRGQLASHESVVTKEGIWLGPQWLRVTKAVNEKEGVLQREQEIKHIKASLVSLQHQIENNKTSTDEQQRLLQEAEQSRERLQQSYTDCHRQLSERRSAIQSKQTKIEHLQERRKRVQQDIDDAHAQFEQEQTAIKEARLRLQQATGAMATDESKRAALVQQKSEIQESVNQARQSFQERKDSAHSLALRVQWLSTQLDSAKENCDRLEKQLLQLNDRTRNLKESLETNIRPLAGQKVALEQALKKRVAEEAALSEARNALEAIEHYLRELDTKRHKIERENQEIRNQLEQSRLDFQSLELKAQSLVQVVVELAFDIKEVLAELPDDADVSLYAEELEATKQRIQRLGAINLVAIEELEKQTERKEYLDSQNQDLEDALKTLQNAIAKIDKETKARFKETFDTVNENLQQLFPKVFGGGHAYLELTGQDLLDTGVAVIARPPGKRNSSIHLLSGGEKALTAIALVFAIFHLNPSPFCMLDEVDAPLDDANVLRFCSLIKEMSDKVQFIFITHNKITMELATHLSGVTQQELGVSRIVAVDVDEAAEMVAA